MDKIERALKRPFPVAKLRWRKGQGGSGELVYITARDVMDRLDEVFNVDGWQTRYDFIGNRMICNLSVYIDGEWITKADGADDSNIEAAKGGISDALKRAAVLLGVGRYLYHPSAFDRDKNPASWATPEGYDELMNTRDEGGLK
tara:strand:- start:882 stop:1313 length:432 start_codon:yes stop_codon:yes gene_type:complete